jgi:membrane-associated protease RseP (regulator of RpoE activity)
VLSFAIAALIGGAVTIDETSMRVTVSTGGPGARAGIRDGDRIVAVEGQRITTWEQLRDVIAKRGEQTTRVTIQSAGEETERVVEAVPRVIEGRARLLVGPYVVRRQAGLGEALASGAATPFAILAATARGFAGIAAGERTELSSAADVAREASRMKQVASGMKLGAGIASYVWPVVAFLMLGLFLVRRPP